MSCPLSHNGSTKEAGEFGHISITKYLCTLFSGEAQIQSKFDALIQDLNQRTRPPTHTASNAHQNISN